MGSPVVDANLIFLTPEGSQGESTVTVGDKLEPIGADDTGDEETGDTEGVDVVGLFVGCVLRQ